VSSKPAAGRSSVAGAEGHVTATGGTTGDPGFQILQGGYVLAGLWHGYAWTAGLTSGATGAGTTTITPSDFGGVAAGATELCAEGSIGAASDYGGVAMIGVNLNQAESAHAGVPPYQTVEIGGSGITVKYTNPGGSQIRVQVQTPDGQNSSTGRWCATLSGAGGEETVRWTSFWGGVADGTQGCWNSGGINLPMGTQISQVELLVPGGNTAPVAYSMCLQGITQAP
jgi:hypothetical protein